MSRNFLAIFSRTLAVSLLAGFCLTSRALAQRPPVLLIAAPASGAALTHDQTDADQTFAPQRWAVTSTNKKGATVVFSTVQAFTHSADPSFKRDARLDLAIASSERKAKWIVTVARDQTDHAAAVPYEAASVQAVSRKDGSATFDLQVTFLTDQYDALAEGDYALTVVGTLTTNR
jgi:hypothetical protein